MNNIIENELIPICKECNVKMIPCYYMDVDEITGRRKRCLDCFSCPSCLKQEAVDSSFDITIN